jgi:hypothetical protein
MTWCVTNGRNHTLVPSLAILASTLLWGTLWIPLRALHHAGLGGAWATTTGFTIPLLCLLPGAFLRRQRIVAGGRSLLGTGLLAALGIALYAQGLLRGEVARVILLFYLMPVWSTLLAWWILGHSIVREFSPWRERRRAAVYPAAAVFSIPCLTDGRFSTRAISPVTSLLVGFDSFWLLDDAC